MKVCIAGGGRVGRYLAQSLLANRHEIVDVYKRQAHRIPREPSAGRWQCHHPQGPAALHGLYLIHI